MCGNQRLQSLLRRSVTTVELRNTKRFVHLDLPLILGELPLVTSLKVIRGGHHLRHPRTSLNVLRRLGTAIEELHLDFFGAHELCLPNFISTDSLVSHLFDSSNDLLLHEPHDPFLDSVNLCISFPKLKTLGFGWKCRLTAQEIRTLPTTLTSLKIGLCEDTIDLRSFSNALPRSLLDLSVDLLQEVSADFFEGLPPSLVSIDLSNSNYGETQLFESLPRSLTRLITSDLMNPTVHELSKFPSSLTTCPVFVHYGNPQDMLSLLPPTITTLGAPERPWPTWTQQSLMSHYDLHLFPHLTKILYSIAIDGLRDPLPHNLIWLCAHSKDPLPCPASASFARLLPHSLEFLHLTLKGDIHGDFFLHLPKTLRQLRLICDKIESLPSLPPFLHTLHLNSRARIPSVLTHVFPPCLTNLGWSVAESTWFDLLAFPTHLKHLFLDDLLLPTHFDSSDRIIMERIHLLNEIGRKEGLLRENEKCHLIDDQVHNFGFLALLPRTITELTFGENIPLMSLDVHEWLYLPQSLRKLVFSGGQELPANALDFILPKPCLTDLGINSCTISDAHVKILPKSLTNLDLGWTSTTWDVKPETFRFAPPEVRELDFNQKADLVKKWRHLMLEALHHPDPTLLHSLLHPSDI